MKQFLIVTADDFGLHPAVNEAVEQASGAGVLTAASLMMAAPATEDAIARARRLPHLRVGLHVVLADGWAVLPPHLIPGLADQTGHMSGQMVGRAMRIFALPRVREQLEAEIRAQFAAFARSGLRLDHVNVHKHFHLHPSVLGVLLRVGREFGAPPMRVPHEPLWFAAKIGARGAGVNGGLLAPWIALMKRRLRAEGVTHNDRVFGVAASGAMDEATLLAILERLPPGISEIYLHPATLSGPHISDSMPDYRHADELAALLSPRVRDALLAAGVGHGGYGDLARERALDAA
jgi:hopanoid biosynthesis associated protein HpnK